jgi:hypothetical protein
MAERALPIQPPRPVCETMPNAVRTAILHENTLADINLSRWADTYRCGVEDIRQAWEAELGRQTQQPQNDFDVEGK